ncbi:MAG: hypothetical protein AB1401_00540 [Thermodesulfobacteriota bacterium]
MSINLQETFKLGHAWRYSNPRTPTDYLPLVYGYMKGGSKGIWNCPCIDTVNFYYLISDSTILSAGDGNSFTVYDKDGNVIDPADYTIVDDHTDENGKHIAIIDFVADQATKEPISIRCKGKNSSSSLIENPIEVIEDFVVNVVGGASSDFDAFALQKAKDICSGYECAGLINGDRSIGTTLSEILYSFNGEWWKNNVGKIVILINTINQVFDHKGEVFEKYVSNLVATQDEKNLCNQAEVLYAYNYRLNTYEEGDDGNSTKDQLSQSIHGAKIKTCEFKWCRDLSTANAVQSVIVDRFKDSVWMISFDDATLRNVHFETGDFVLFSHSELYDKTRSPFQNRIVQVMSKVVSLNEGFVSFEVVDKNVSYHSFEETFEDVVNVSELISKTFGKGAFEQIGISELIAMAVTKVAADGVSISEAVAKDVHKIGRNVVTSLGSITCNLSLVNGVAFVTNPSVDLTPYIGKLLTLKAGGKTLTGWIKAAGTGETYGSETLSNPEFIDASAWNTVLTGWTLGGGVATYAPGDVYAHIYQATSPSVGSLMRVVVIANSVSAGWFILDWPVSYFYNTAGTKIIYGVATGGLDNKLIAYYSLIAEFESYSVKQVLTPSPTGVTIVSTKGGSVYNWASNDGIDPNAVAFDAYIGDEAEKVWLSEQAWKNWFKYDGVYDHNGAIYYGKDYGVLV